MTIKPEFTQEEYNSLLALIDSAMKAAGLQSLEAVKAVTDKLKIAVDEANKKDEQANG